MNRLADALIGAATANVRHRGVDVGVARMPILLEQRRGSHELARLTVAALRNVLGNPGFLYRVQRTVLRAEAFDSRDLLGPDRRDGQIGRASCREECRSRW